MSYYSDIFDRLDIQHMREFLLQGTEAIKIKQEGYKERIDKYRIAASNLIERKYPDKEECEVIMGCMYDYGAEIEDVFMEIGLQCGFQLAMQLTMNKHQDEE